MRIWVLLSYYVSLGITLLMGCGSSEDLNRVHVNTRHLAPSFNVEEHLPIVDTIALNFNSDIVIGDVGKILGGDNFFALLHHHGDFSQRYVTVFDTFGRFKYHLQPSDNNYYSFRPLDIAINNEGNLELLEGKTNELWLYDTNGHLEARKKLAFSASNFAYLGEENGYVFYKNNKVLPKADTSNFYDIIFTDGSLRITQKHYPFKPTVGAYTRINLPYPLGNFSGEGAAFARSLTDTLITFTDNRRSPELDILFDFSYAITDLKKKRSDLTEIDMQEVLNLGGGLLAGYYAYGDGWLSFNFITVNGPAWGLFELSSGQMEAGQAGLSKGGDIFPSFVSYLPGRGFATVLNESSLPYIASHYLDSGLAKRVINTNKAFLLIAAKK